jgi:predicted HAD superfamily Cof-like phosphohydrolase
MKKQIDKVKEFHEAFNVDNSKTMTLLPVEDYTLRYNLLKEELDEYMTACQNNNIVEVADALGDQLYIIIGTMLRHGLQDKMEEVFDEIHSSNMSKLDASGKPIFREDGKIMKSSLYFRPQISKILENGNNIANSN